MGNKYLFRTLVLAILIFACQRQLPINEAEIKNQIISELNKSVKAWNSGDKDLKTQPRMHEIYTKAKCISGIHGATVFKLQFAS